MRTLVLLLLLSAAAPADEFKDAFKRLRLPKASKLAKDIAPRLPAGIVIEPGPFDALVAKLLEPYAAQLDLREKVMPGLDARKATSAFKVLTKENDDLVKSIMRVEDTYAQAYNRGYMESSEGARRDRKLAATLIPFYRRLMLRNARIASLARPDAAALTAPDPALRAAAVEAAAGRGELEAVRKAAVSDRHPAVRSRALRSLLKFKIAAIEETVIAALQDPAWEVRALAATICVRARLVAATGALIAALEKEPGRLRKDLDDALFALTGVRMYGDVALWRKWYESNRETVERKAKELREQGAYDKPLGSLEGGDAEGEGADEAKRKGATSAFYGITTQSKRIVFIIDISRSMQDTAAAKPGPTSGRKKNPYEAPKGGTKLDIAKWQLHRAVHDLPKDAVFDILVYSESYKLWEPEMVDASARGKKKAHRFIDQLNGNGTTNIADSLDRALALIGVTFGPGADRREDLAADTIYLLSDGNPNRGRLSDLDALLDEFVARNRLARLVVHTIGIGEAAGSTFLKELARRTGGRYVGFR